MEYSLAGAAEAIGISKSALHRAIQKGRLSARKLEDGSYRIDASELARAFPPSQPEPQGPSPWDTKGQAETTRDEAGTPGTELAVLRLKVKMLEDQLERERELRDRERETILATNQETVEDLRKRLDRAEERVLALTAPVPEKVQERPVAPAPEVTAAKPSRGLLGRFWGR